MLGFKKKVAVQSFWQPRLDGMFSGKNEPGWDALKASFQDPALDVVQPVVFYKHIQAITIEIVSIVIAKKCSAEVSTSSMLFVSDFLRERSRLDVDDLVTQYSSAFGSSFTDGIRPMVEFFSKEVSGSTLAPSTAEGLYKMLHLLAQEVTKTLRSVKLVASTRRAEELSTPVHGGPLPWLDVNGLPGVIRDPDGTLRFEFTEEEQVAVNREFSQFKGPDGEPLLVHPEVHDELQNALTARGLWFYADDQVHEMAVAEPRKPKALNNAAAALAKAYSLYPLPLFLRYFSLLLRKMGEPGRADRALAEWREAKASFRRSKLAAPMEESMIGCASWEE